MTIRTELMIRRVQFIRRTHEAATQVACAGNTRGYDNGENDDAYYIFFDHITTATTPHPILYLMKRTSYNSITQLQSNLSTGVEVNILKAYSSKKGSFYTPLHLYIYSYTHKHYAY